MLPRPRCWVTGAIEKCKPQTYKSSTTSIGVNGDNKVYNFTIFCKSLITQTYVLTVPVPLNSMTPRMKSGSSVWGGGYCYLATVSVVWWVSCVFCRDHFLVFIHFTHRQLPNCVILVWGTLGIVWTVRFAFVNIQKVKTKIILVVNSGETKFQQLSTVNFVDISYHSFHHQAYSSFW